MPTFELSTLKFCERVKEFLESAQPFLKTNQQIGSATVERKRFGLETPRQNAKSRRKYKKPKILRDRRDWKFCKEIHLAPANGHVEPVTESD